MQDFMKQNAKWIRPAQDTGDVCPMFFRRFPLKKTPQKAVLSITALGVYEAFLNGSRIGDFILAPGWTAYEKRLQVQTYDVTRLLSSQNELSVTVGKGWYRGRIAWPSPEETARRKKIPAGLIAALTLTFSDGSQTTISTDETWQTCESPVRASEIYDGEIFDARTALFSNPENAVVFDGPSHTLIPQQGPFVTEQERILPVSVFTTPAGERVVDFGQEVTGYPEISLTAACGERLELSCAETLDQDGNFYTENYRSAKAKYTYLCKDGFQTCKPRLTFYGFRYLRLDQFPGGADSARPEQFCAVAVHSDMARTGHLSCSDPLLNRFFENVIWGQKGNFVDVPTDCPQRDERLGWTGDAQVFIRTACFNFDAEAFYRKWLADLSADQSENGMVCHVIPAVMDVQYGSAAWGDAATVCPWELYLAYGDPRILKDQFESMKKWVDYITLTTSQPNLWTGGEHYGDWLGLDAPAGSYKGSTREDFIASAFYAYSTELVIRAGKIIGADVSSYEKLYADIVSAFRTAYPVYTTQTECVLAARFHLAPDCQKAADQLARMIRDCGVQLQTGFVGTPYLLHVLSDHGYADLAWSLLLKKDYPSWLYPVTKGATTVWEHWDGIMENGSFWSKDMNSFNHYAYGAVLDWVYGNAAGISSLPGHPGYEKISVAPLPDARLDWLSCSYQSRFGMIRSEWKKQDGMWRYEIETPVDAVITIDGQTHTVGKGRWIYFSKIR